MKFLNSNHMDDSLLVDISDALSEKDRVRFTVHTRTKLPQFAKPVLSVVRQHEEFVWLHECLCENDQYAGYIIPPPPPKPDFDSSRDKLQRLGDCEANLTKDEFAKMKQELEAEYLAIFKKTVAMHEIFLQRLAAHEKFRDDNNFKIFLEYENELAVRGKSKREKLAGSIQNIGKSLTDFVITTSQVASSNSISNLASGVSGNHYGGPSSSNHISYNQAMVGSDNSKISPSTSSVINTSHSTSERSIQSSQNNLINNNNNNTIGSPDKIDEITSTSASNFADENTCNDLVDEHYFELERLFLALYYNSIRDTAICADKVTQAHKFVADSYLHISQQLVKLASIEVVPITSNTVDSSSFVSCPLPSLTLPTNKNEDSALDQLARPIIKANAGNHATEKRLELLNDDRRRVFSTDQNNSMMAGPSSDNSGNNDISNLHIKDSQHSDNLASNVNANMKSEIVGGCANDHTSEGLKRLLLHVSDYLEQARRVETRIASDEDLKLTDTLLYYKRDTVAAQDLLMRRFRYMSEYESATKNLEKSRAKGRTAMQYADVIQKQAKENFLSLSKLAKQELLEYKKRRVVSFKKAFTDIAELEIKHLRSHSQLIVNCLNICRGLYQSEPVASTSRQPEQAATSSGK